MADHARIFSEGDYLAGTLPWGWQCFACRSESTGFGNASTAQESCDNHVALCPAVQEPPC